MTISPTRRRFLALSASVSFASSPLWRGCNNAFAQNSPSATPASAPQPEPVRTTLAAHLHSYSVRPLPAEKTSIWGFNGQYPAPILRVPHGQSLAVEWINNTPSPLAFHWHGVRQAVEKRELAPPPILSGQRATQVIKPLDAGFFLYRPLIIGQSAEPAARGLGGALIVEEASPPVVDAEHVLLVQDWLLNEQHQLAPFERSAALAAGGRLGNVLTVNGKTIPERLSFAPSTRVRIRLGNVCVSRIMRVRFDDMKVHVIAIDGQPTDTFEPLRSTLPFPPGTRYDLIVEMPPEDKKVGFITVMIGSGTALVAFETSAKIPLSRKSPLPPLSPLAPNALLAPAIRLQEALRADLILEGGAKITPEGKMEMAHVNMETPWRVNGSPASQGQKPLFNARKGQPIVLTIANKTDFPQPIHIHGHVFRLLHPFDDGWEPYWLDTLHVPEQRTVRIAFMVEEKGKWLIASTNLERFDAGLWSWFEVN
jgi:FtsP/CotA-like multicopper oxidase with cupredoxin domain